jgi:hypothetical protein
MKTQLNYFFSCLGAEIRKSRHTFALWLTMLYPLFVIALVSVAHLGAKFEDTNPWTRYIYNIGETGSFFFPFFLIAIIGFYGNIEHKSNTWKHILSMPVPKWAVFTGKLGMVFLLLVLSLIFFILFTYSFSFLLNIVSKRMTFGEGGISFHLLIRQLGRSFLSGFFIIALQYWLSIRIRNLIVPFIIGLVFIILPLALVIILGMTGLISDPTMIEKIFSYDPYSYPFTHAFKLSKEAAAQIHLFPAKSQLFGLISILILILAYLDFSKKNIH